jgi:hypothetical protein
VLKSFSPTIYCNFLIIKVAVKCGGFLCGGFMVSLDTIVTAAHCCDKVHQSACSKSNFFVMAGKSTSLETLGTSQQVHIMLRYLLTPRLYSKVWPMLSIFDSNKQKTPLEISVVFDRWGAVL